MNVKLEVCINSVKGNQYQNNTRICFDTVIALLCFQILIGKPSCCLFALAFACDALFQLC